MVPAMNSVYPLPMRPVRPVEVVELVASASSMTVGPSKGVKRLHDVDEKD